LQSLPPGALTPEGVQPLVRAMQHFSGHIQAAEAKGMPGQMIGQFKQAYAEAAKHLTAGHGTPPPPDIQPAAAHQGRPGGPRPTAAGMQQMGQVYSQKSPNQNAMIEGIANPPRPPTAA
jgi:hypothetical protein